MDTIIGLAILALLVVIALELYLVVIGVSKLPALMSTLAATLATTRDEKKEQPTINVNVGTVPQAEARTEASRPTAANADPLPAPAEPAVLAAATQAPAEAESERVATPPPPQQAPKARSLQSTASGLLVIKCPVCQAENSTYRQVCFNCGGSIHPAN